MAEHVLNMSDTNVQDGAFVKMFNMVLSIYLNIPWSLNMVCDKNTPGFWIWVGHTKFWICESMLLNNAWICLNISETEPKITI